MSYAKSSVFRKVALDRLSSPEQLDLLMQVTSTRSWLAFVASALLVATAVYWAIFGQIPLRYTTTAVLIPTGGIRNIIGVEQGQLYAWHVGPGDIVEEGQIVAEILPVGQEVAVPIRSLHHGRILQHHIGIGELAQPGDTLSSLQFVGPEIHLEAVLYLSLAEVRQLRPGMSVNIEPISSSGIAPLSGKIVTISEFPVTAQNIAQLLGSNAAFHSLSVAENPIEVRVLIETDSSTADLPPELIGTTASATVQLGVQRPIELALPQR